MRLNFNSSLHLSDTLVPDLFITEYVSKLSGNAIRCYLILLLTFQHGNRKAAPSDLAQRLGINEEKAEQALSELQQLQLIIIQSGQIELVDLKIKEVKRNFTQNKSGEDLNTADIPKREAIIRQIDDTFFQGVMALGFYTKIDEWFEKYQFEPEVVYAIFSEAASKNKLDGPGYASGIADNWGSYGIKTYSQLNQYYKNYKERRTLINNIRKQLNIKNPLSKYQEEMVDKWIRIYNFNFEIIDLAMSQTVNVSSPSFKYIDTILTNWYDQGLETVDEIKQEMADYRKEKLVLGTSTKTKKHVLKSSEQSAEDIQEEELYRFDLLDLYPGEEEDDK